MNFKNPKFLRLAALTLLASLFLFTSCIDQGENKNPSIVVSNDFKTITVNDYPKSEINSGNIDEYFLIYLLNEQTELVDGQLAVSGNYELTYNKAVYRPSYSFVAEQSYLIRFKHQERWIEKKFQIPGINKITSTEVVEVYPSSDTLPRNILKFYIQFSDSMAERFSYQNIHLLDSKLDTIPDAFLELEEELWSTDMKRFTLLFDPGRIKRGLGSQEDMGYTFQVDDKYSLIIKSSWLDAKSQSLKNEFQKDFFIRADDREKPNIDLWKIQLPKAGTRDKITINFKEPLDYALAIRVINIIDQDGKHVIGASNLTDHERMFSFIPNRSWIQGDYKLQIEQILEDQSGNNLKNLFDIDNQADSTDLSHEVYKYLPFAIN